jgi:hypothetical protein
MAHRCAERCGLSIFAVEAIVWRAFAHDYSLFARREAIRTMLSRPVSGLANAC